MVLLVLATTMAAARPQNPAPAGAGGMIHGRVAVPASPAAMERPTVAEPPQSSHPQVNRRRVVVYLESAPRQAFGELPVGRARMDQRAEQFVPRVLAITVGTTVDFPNSDNTYHNVFSLRGPRPFDLGRYAAGHSKSVRFDRPGIVRVFCEIHSHMSAFVLVFNHRYFAVTSADGRYQITRVPPGRYTLVAWNEGAIRESRQVVIPEDGGTVESDFSLR